MKARLLAEKRKRSGRNGETSSGQEGVVLATKSKKEGGERPKFPGKCFGCGAFGHKRAACPNPKVRNQHVRAQAAGILINREVALVSPCEARNPENYKMQWILDSGASRHMVNEEKYFSSFVSWPPPLP